MEILRLIAQMQYITAIPVDSVHAGIGPAGLLTISAQCAHRRRKETKSHAANQMIHLLAEDAVEETTVVGDLEQRSF